MEDYLKLVELEEDKDLKYKVVEEIREECCEEYKRLIRLVQYAAERNGVVLTTDEAKRYFLDYVVDLEDC